MLNLYQCTVRTYIDREKVYVCDGGKRMCEDCPEAKTIDISWDNLDEIYRHHGCALPFNIWNLRKGRLISFFIRRPDIKEWKIPKLNITFEAKWDKINPSINDVLNWPDGEQAIQYLVSRGLAIK